MTTEPVSKIRTLSCVGVLLCYVESSLPWIGSGPDGAIGPLAVGRAVAPQPAPTRLALELQDYAALPITADNTNTNTRAQLARVNYMRDEPGGRRFFVNDLNGPLYILDKQKRTFTTYLDFNGRGGRPGLFPKFTFERNFATGLTSFIFDPDYAKNGVIYTLHMEDPATEAPAAPRVGIVAGLDLSGYTTTHGSTDGEIFSVIKRGLPPTMMAGYDGRIPDADIWSIVNYLRTLRQGM